MKRTLFIVGLLLAAGVVLAGDVDVPEADSTEDAEAKTETKDGAKMIDGMSILGNQEAPKSLVIVPWKSSVLGNSLGIATMLDDTKQPIDREVFLRALSYYEIRSETSLQGPTGRLVVGGSK